jgi:DnaJ family protein A protein 2
MSHVCLPQFKKINHAFEILNDEDKRKLYDAGGEEAVEQGGVGGGNDAHDIFSAFFGGGGRQRGPKKGEDLVHPIAVTLEDLYNGKTVKLALTRNRICSDCDGSGSKHKGADTTCPDCGGRGVKMITRQIGPGMIQQMQARCPGCGGSGTSVKEKDKCKGCEGKKVLKEKKVLEVPVEKGMRHQQRICFSGEADEAPGMAAGDLVFVIQQKEHTRFIRKGNDLLTQRKVSLTEALCGATICLDHLDGRQIVLRTKPGEVIRPGDVKCVQDEGMPMHKNPFVKGKLFIQFQVEFPKQGALSTGSLAALEKALPEAPKQMVTDEAEEHHMHAADLEHLGRGQNGRGNAHDEDDDEDMGGGGQRVQCAQQ